MPNKCKLVRNGTSVKAGLCGLCLKQPAFSIESVNQSHWIRLWWGLQVPSFDSKVAMTMIEQELGRPWQQVYSQLTPRPIAAASLGQVCMLARAATWSCTLDHSTVVSLESCSCMCCHRRMRFGGMHVWLWFSLTYHVSINAGSCSAYSPQSDGCYSSA